MTPKRETAEVIMYRYLSQKAKKGAVAFASASDTPTGEPLIIYRKRDELSHPIRWLYGAKCGAFHFSATGQWLVWNKPKDHPTPAEIKELDCHLKTAKAAYN